MSFTLEAQQVLVRFEILVRSTLQTPSCDFDINSYVLDQAPFAHIVVLWPYEAQHQQIHARAVKVLREGMEDMDFLYHNQLRRRLITAASRECRI